MTGDVSRLLASGYRRTHSRPSERRQPLQRSQFKTLKYRHGFPSGSARSRTRGPSASVLRVVQPEHRHSGIAMFTPADVHYGRAAALHEAPGRARRRLHRPPQRFVMGPPRAALGAAWRLE